MKKYVLFLMIAFVLGACNTKKEEGLQVVKVYEGTPTENFDDFINSVEVVPLQTADSCLISYIFNLQKGTDGSWYILSAVSAGGTNIKHFGSDGKYLNSVGKQGQGPGEYRELYHFMITGDTIHFFDWNTRKWIQRLKDNSLIAEKRLPISLDGICRVKDKFFVYTKMGINETEEKLAEDKKEGKTKDKKEDNLKHYLCLLDKDFKVLKMFDPKDPKRIANAFLGRNNFYAIEDGNYLYQRDYNDTIYEIDASALEVKAKYVPDYGAITPPESYLTKIFTEDMMKAYQTLMADVKYPKDIKIAASPNYLLYVYFSGGEINANYLTIYDREKKVSHIFNSAKTPYLTLFTDIFGYDGSKFYGLISAEKYLKLVAELPDTPLYKDLKEKAKTLKEDDNPVLVLFTLK